MTDPRPRPQSKRDRIFRILAEEIEDPGKLSRILARIDEEVDLPHSTAHLRSVYVP
jgi:hypothetical protein